MFQKLKYLASRTNAFSEQWGNLISVILIGGLITLGLTLMAVDLPMERVDATLEAQQCQFTVEVTSYWKQPSSLLYSQMRDMPVRSFDLATRLYEEACASTIRDSVENVGIVDYTVVRLVEDCYFGADTIYTNIIGNDSCTTCHTGELRSR